MRSRSALLALALIVGTLGVSVPIPAQEADTHGQRYRVDNRDPRAISHVYRVTYLNENSILDAVMVAHQICLDQPGERICEYRVEGNKWFTYVTDEATHELIGAEMAKRDVAPTSLNFRVVILVADDQERAAPDLPKGESNALADLKQFLPYKGYRLVDSGTVRTINEAEFLLGARPSYAARLAFYWNDFPVRRDLAVKRFRLVKFVTRPDGGEEGKQILDTSFSLQVGETVVVGTSKLNGSDEALIVLLTATE